MEGEKEEVKRKEVGREGEKEEVKRKEVGREREREIVFTCIDPHANSHTHNNTIFPCAVRLL